VAVSLDSGPPGDHTDYLVIGSGFGGSVMTSALAAAGRTVCLLERGRPYPPGTFPRTPDGVATNFWDPSKNLYGMFNVWSFQDVAAIVSSGLGGGSLIYANVMLEKPPGWFSQPVPGASGDDETWSFDADDLAPHYDRVKAFLQVQTMPPEFAAADSPKTTRFLEASGNTASYAPLAVRFRDTDGQSAIGAPLPEEPYGNIFGSPRRTTCRLIGECDIGCNEGAKSSMDHTYLSKAHHDDASIHVLTEVKTISRRPGTPTDGYLFDVDYVVHTPGAAPTAGSIRAKRVILAAGALGTTYLLLKNAATLGVPPSSPVGERFCGNGDLLGLATPNDTTNYEASKGPVITAYREFHDGVRMTLQDGGVPTIMLWLLKTVDAPGLIGRLFSEALDYVWQRIVGSNDNDLAAELSRVLGGSPPIGRSLPILAMGADVPDGRLTIDEHGILENSWSTASSRNYFAAVRHRMNALRHGLGAYLRPEPSHPSSQAITVHPLGGCPADTSAFEGVVDSYGRVHGVPGLWITDGSIFPGPVGVNPSLTIAAFASRAAEKLLAEADLDAAPIQAERFSA
jgi:cholesterol oxidase